MNEDGTDLGLIHHKSFLEKITTISLYVKSVLTAPTDCRLIIQAPITMCDPIKHFQCVELSSYIFILQINDSE